MSGLSRKMQAVLVALADLADEGKSYPATPNVIGYECGFERGMARRGNHGHGNVSRTMGPAVHVTTALTALRKRKLVDDGPRLDGLSGSAYYLTKDGRYFAARARAHGVQALDASAQRRLRRE